ncbi:Uncharacterized protein GBIM_01382, partial [Gryllus bimaculatus]
IFCPSFGSFSPTARSPTRKVQAAGGSRGGGGGGSGGGAGRSRACWRPPPVARGAPRGALAPDVRFVAVRRGVAEAMRCSRAAPAAAVGPVALLVLCAAGAAMCDPVSRESKRESVTRGAGAREPVQRTEGAVPRTVVMFDGSVFNSNERVVQIPGDSGVVRGSSASTDVIQSDSTTPHSPVHTFVVTRKSVTADVKDPGRNTRVMMNPNVVSDSNRQDVVAHGLLSSDAPPSSGLTVNSFASVASSVDVSERLRNSPQDIQISSECRECPEVSVKLSDESEQEKSSRTMRHVGVLGINKHIVNTNKDFKDDGRKKPPDKLKNIIQKRNARYNILETEHLTIPRKYMLSVIASEFPELQTDERTVLDNDKRDGENNWRLTNSRNVFETNNLNRIASNNDVKTIALGKKWSTPQIRSSNDVVLRHRVKSPIRGREVVNRACDRPGADDDTNNEAVNDKTKRASINLRHLTTILESYNEAKLVAEIKDQVKRNFTVSAKRTVPPINRSEIKFYQVLEKLVNKSITTVIGHIHTSRDNNYSDAEGTVQMMDYEMRDKVRSVRSVSAVDGSVKIEWNWQNAAKNRDDRVKIASDFLPDDSVTKGEIHVSNTENIQEEVGKIENQVVTGSTVQGDLEVNSKSETRVKIDDYFQKTEETESSSVKSTQDSREPSYGYSTLPPNVPKLIPTNEEEDQSGHLHPERLQLHDTLIKYVPSNDYVMLTPNGTEMYTSTEASEVNGSLTDWSTEHDISGTVVKEEVLNKSGSTETDASDMTQLHLQPEMPELHDTYHERMKYVPNNDYVMSTPNGTEMYTSTEASEANEGLTERTAVRDISGTVVDEGLEVSKNSDLSISLKTINARHEPFTSNSNVTIYHNSSVRNSTVLSPEISVSTEGSKVTNELTSTLPLNFSITENPLPTDSIKTPHSPARTTFANVEEMLSQASTEQKIVIERPSTTAGKSNLAKEVTSERLEVRYPATQLTVQETEPLNRVTEETPLSELIDGDMKAPKVEYSSKPDKTRNGKALESRSFVSTNLTQPDLEMESGTIEELNSEDESESRDTITQGSSTGPGLETSAQTIEEISSEQRLNLGNSTTELMPNEHELESRNSTTEDKHPLELITERKPKTSPGDYHVPVSILPDNATHEIGVDVVEDNVSGRDTGVKYTEHTEKGTQIYPKSPPHGHPVSTSTIAPNNMTHGMGETLRNSDAKPNSSPSDHSIPIPTSAPNNITRGMGVAVTEGNNHGGKPNTSASDLTMLMSTAAPGRDIHALGVAMIQSHDNGPNSNSSSTDPLVPMPSSAPGAVLHALGVAMIEGSSDAAGSTAATTATATATAAAAAASAPPQFDLLDRHLACARADELSGPANPSRCTYEWDGAGGDLPLVRCDLFQALPGQRTPSGRLCLYPVSYTVVRSEALGDLSGSVLRDDPLLETLRSERDKQTLTVVLSHGFRQVALRLRHDAIGPRGLLNKDPCRGCKPEVWIFQYKKDISVARLYLNRAFGLSMLFEPAYVNLAKFWLQRLKPEAFLEELEVHGGESWGNPGADLLPTLSRLRRVDLAENGISEIPLENFERNPWIEELFLARNKFSTVPAGISLLTNLHILDMSGNLLITQGLALTLQPLTELRKLNLSFVPLRDFEVLSPEFVSHESSYEIDNLNATSYDNMLPQLEVLDVSIGSIRSVSSPAAQRLLSQWPRMRELHLARNPLGALLADLPARLPALQVLDLSGCGLRAGPALRLAPGQRLLRLDVSSNALEGPQGLVAA